MNLPGISSKIIPPAYSAKKLRAKKRKKGPMTNNDISLIIESKMKKNRVIKYIETLLANISATTTGNFVQLSSIIQGVLQHERIADTVWIQRIDYSLNFTTGNADIFNLVRMVFFIWKTSTALALPTTNEIFNNWAFALIHSMLNFERRDTYHLLKDTRYNMSGTASNPTNYSQQLQFGTIKMNNRIDFDPSILTAYNHVYVFFASDSAAIPFPVLQANFRLWYYDD